MPKTLFSTVLQLADTAEDKRALKPLAPIDARDLEPNDVYSQDLYTLLYQLAAVSELAGALSYSILDNPVPVDEFDATLSRLRRAQTVLRSVIFEKFRRRA